MFYLHSFAFWGIITKMNEQFIANSVEDTEKYAEQLGKSLNGGEVLLLCGEMGAGKTHFTKGLAKGLGIDDVITSPTFALHNIYYGRLILNHFDFYRVEDPDEVAILGLDEFFYDKNAVSAIEWSSNIADLVPRKHIVVSIEKLNETKRKINVLSVHC